VCRISLRKQFWERMDQIAAISFSLVLFYAQTNGLVGKISTGNHRFSHDFPIPQKMPLQKCFQDATSMIYTYIYTVYIYIIHIYSVIGETIYIYIHTFTTTETGETTLSRTVFFRFSASHPRFIRRRPRPEMARKNRFPWE